MTKELKYKLKHRPFVVLGLISEKQHEGGCHAYEINKRIEERGMRNWTNIGVDFSFSTIYRILDRLEKGGLVESYLEEVDNRERKNYSITDYGYEILRIKVYNVLYNFIGRNDRDFYVAFSMFPILPFEEQINVFSNSLKTIEIHKKDLEIMLEQMLAGFSNMPVNVTGLFIHPIKVLQTDIEFLEMVLQEIKKRGEQIDSDAYGQ